MLSPDLMQRLQARQTEMIELFLTATDSETLPGLDTRENRGDTQWLLKIGNHALGIAIRIGQLEQQDDLGDEDQAQQVEKIARDAEAKAAKLIARARAR
jgi:hypothetical protein